MKRKRKILKDIYSRLYRRYGPQNWWPADDAFEIIAGAIFTQNTNWGNVEKAIGNLKRARVLTPKKLHSLSVHELAGLIRPAGYFNIKAKRLKCFLNRLFDDYGGNLGRLFKRRTATLRRELLTINGIGPETADSILLYAAGRPVFVIDAYTRRVLLRHGLISEKADYEATQRLFMENLPHDAKTFNEYHALLVRIGKDYCKKKNPLCGECPLSGTLPKRPFLI
jgi:endonuclease-3 related protein